ncbi:MAG: hypothetical protein RBS07_09270 [Lentimicrobium sp.]|jgi:hypothetical protein|nr:hypothetical protein [Lentimicrobium sp.]
MKKITGLLIMLMTAISAQAQNCEGFFPMKQGAVIETQSFNPKDKLQGTNRQTILAVDQIEDGMAITVKSEQLDEKGKPSFEQELTMRCVDDVFYMDMKEMLDPKTMGGFKDMEVSVSGVDLEFPGIMEVGQTLNDGNIEMSASSSGFTVMNMTVKILNRKVEAYEPVTTPAGTFDCFKISYDIEMHTIVNIKAKGTEWVAKNVGVVKSEQYDKNGKLTGYTLLSQFTN